MKFRHSMTYALAWMIFIAFISPCQRMMAQNAAPTVARQKIILNTDIGDDIGDAFALGLALSSPNLQLLGVTSAWGDTDLRARLVACFPRSDKPWSNLRRRWSEDVGQLKILTSPMPSNSSSTRFVNALARLRSSRLRHSAM
jgi:hypothetical protein